ncbi:hypothetical protein Nepgr_030835 [Nepenthes gracilis]|uniref:Uncharacterized protein n=1 Tax=Nepenthes gracilis TaxID=150966 RepID=A0AAD3Y464_NEPGR|nr:hypothetical protein Nepgr_030835 [Nepenthes gracilis]
MACKSCANHRTKARNYIQNTGKKASLVKMFGNIECCPRHLLCGLQDDRITTRQCGLDFPGQHGKRKVPRNDQSSYTDQPVEYLHMVWTIPKNGSEDYKLSDLTQKQPKSNPVVQTSKALRTFSWWKLSIYPGLARVQMGQRLEQMLESTMQDSRRCWPPLSSLGEFGDADRVTFACWVDRNRQKSEPKSGSSYSALPNDSSFAPMKHDREQCTV